MLPSASALASRREERVQKAFSVDHHGPGDARLSHRATAIYGEHSDYVRGRPIVLTVHNVTTARDLQAHRASAARRRASHGQLARNNLSTLKGLNAQPGVSVTVRAGAGPPPARLQRIADQAAQSGDLRSKHPADCASCANAPWDELRVWDPGD